MSKEIIAISPVYDKTPYYSAEYYLNRRRKTTSSHKKTITRAISFVLALNMVVCLFFFCANNENLEAVMKRFVITNLSSGLISDLPADTQITPADKPSSDWIPTVADPTEDEEPNEEPIIQANPSLEAFLKLYEFDYSSVPDGLYPIIPYDLSSEADGSLKLYNDTSINVDINAFAAMESSANGIAESEEPIVLIIHTHGTEAYSEEGVLGYSDTYNIPRSYDVTKNVIHIGGIIASVLNENGVNTVQCDVMHDAESYMGAYSRSAETVSSYLKRYPSIKYVFDVHRDSVLLEDKTKTRPVTIADGQVAAQIMTVAGSNELGTYHPEWETNLRLAAKLQTKLNESHLGLARAICLRGSSYNQELSPYSLLFEVGSCGNTIKEAEVSARILAEKLAELIKNGW